MSYLLFRGTGTGTERCFGRSGSCMFQTPMRQDPDNRKAGNAVESAEADPNLGYSRADRFEPGGARFEFTLQCVFEDKLKLEL